LTVPAHRLSPHRLGVAEADAQPELRVLIIAGSYPPHIRGGGEISTQIMAESLSALGCEVRVLTCGPAESLEDQSAVVIHRIPSPNIYWNYSKTRGRMRRLIWHLFENRNPRARRMASREIAAFQPDVVVTSTIENFGGEAWLAARRAKVPSVHVLRSYYPFCWRGTAFRDGNNCTGACLGCRSLSFGRRRATDAVTGVIGISRYVLARHLDLGLFGAARPTVISNPIGVLPVSAARRHKASPARFGYLGVLSPNKGLELLNAAWQAVDGTTARLVIAGTGAPDYERGVRELFGDAAEFLGWMDSAQFLQAVDFLIVPSVWNEPFGRIVVEAFAAGVPVIASATGGIPEIVTEGRNGFLFDRNDAAALSMAIRRAAAMSDESYQAISQSALDDAAEYGAVSIGRRYLDFLKDIVALNRKVPRP
jgi:glycosyltransferase involved in cell wall biosynthesis